jgi:hypothetical protein
MMHFLAYVWNLPQVGFDLYTSSCGWRWDMMGIFDHPLSSGCVIIRRLDRR